MKLWLAGRWMRALVRNQSTVNENCSQGNEQQTKYARIANFPKHTLEFIFMDLKASTQKSIRLFVANCYSFVYRLASLGCIRLDNFVAFINLFALVLVVYWLCFPVLFFICIVSHLLWKCLLKCIAQTNCWLSQSFNFTCPLFAYLRVFAVYLLEMEMKSFHLRPFPKQINCNANI